MIGLKKIQDIFPCSNKVVSTPGVSICEFVHLRRGFPTSISVVFSHRCGVQGGC